MLVEHCTAEGVEEKLILALDTGDPAHALDMVDRFGGRVGIFKVGLQLFVKAGPSFIGEIHARGRRVFLDLKFHDIPNTVSGAVIEAARLGVFMLNVHTLGGLEMMKRAMDDLVSVCLKENLDRPRLVGVTILTSADDQMLREEIGIPQRVPTQVGNLAALARKARLDGVVASPREISIVKDRCGPGFIVVTPGIRPPWAPQDDQRRTMTPKQAIMDGADYLVIGRAVTASRSPDDSLHRLIEESVF